MYWLGDIVSMFAYRWCAEWHLHYADARWTTSWGWRQGCRQEHRSDYHGLQPGWRNYTGNILLTVKLSDVCFSFSVLLIEYYAVWAIKNCADLLLSIPSPIIDRFAKFFHWHTLQKICNLSQKDEEFHQILNVLEHVFYQVIAGVLLSIFHTLNRVLCTLWIMVVGTWVMSGDLHHYLF